MRNRTSVVVGGALIAVAALSPLVATAATKTPAKKVAAAAGALKGVCPANIVIQTDWFPEAEHGALYEMIGSDYKIDTKKKTVSGSLVTKGNKKTGVNIEVRTGGPAIGFAGPSAVMATDSSITIGYDYTGSASLWKKLPMIQIVAPLEKNPQMIMWDPATYPNVKTIADLAKAGVSINVFAKSVMSSFIADGIVPDKLVDPSYDGSPARFIAAGGKIAQQGFASAEPYSYKNDFKEWGKDVAFQLFFDAGYQDYSQTLAVRPGDLAKLRPCLKKFVPIVQQAQVDYAGAPDRANAMIIDAVAQYKDSWVYSKGMADFSVAQQKKIGLISNGPDKTLGNFDIPRVQKFIDQMVKSGDFKDIPEGFKAEQMVTNEFIDPKIGLK
jgi:hypothetical protein